MDLVTYSDVYYTREKYMTTVFYVYNLKLNNKIHLTWETETRKSRSVHGNAIGNDDDDDDGTRIKRRGERSENLILLMYLREECLRIRGKKCYWINSIDLNWVECLS